MMIEDRYKAFKVLKEIISEYKIYLRVDKEGHQTYDELKLDDIELDEDDIVIKNLQRVK